MAVPLKPGARVFSSVDTSEFVTVRAPAEPVELTIGGEPAVLEAVERDADRSPAPGHDGGAAVGKRYTDADNTVELLCTKAGAAVPAVGGVLLELKGAKPLPASD